MPFYMEFFAIYFHYSPKQICYSKSRTWNGRFWRVAFDLYQLHRCHSFRSFLRKSVKIVKKCLQQCCVRLIDKWMHCVSKIVFIWTLFQEFRSKILTSRPMTQTIWGFWYEQNILHDITITPACIKDVNLNVFGLCTVGLLLHYVTTILGTNWHQLLWKSP